MHLSKTNIQVVMLTTLTAGFILLFAQAANAGCGSFCRGKSLEHCRSFWVWESSYLHSFNNSDIRITDDDFGALCLDFGFMRNIASRSAIGGSLFFGYDAGEFIGAKARYRHWLSEKVSLDISPGIIVFGNFERAQMLFPGIVGSITLGWGDWVGLTVQFAAHKYEFTEYVYPSYTELGTENNLYLGVRAGSYAAFAVPVVVFAVALLTDDRDWKPRRD